METTNTLIIGASAAGLACAAQLEKRNISYTIIEKSDQVAQKWRDHYDRLHLHTNRSGSTLPFMDFPKGTPKYPAKAEVIKYMEDYAGKLKTKPQFNTHAVKITKENGTWATCTNQGVFKSENIIICTGNAHTPKEYRRKGIESFGGTIMTSAEYKNGKAFEGKKVLVVGFGNSACEIAICLHEHGALPSMSVRSPVNVVPRDIFGIPVLTIGIWQKNLPPRIGDKLNKPLLRWLVGDFTKYGLKKLPYGPREQIVKYHRIPLLDIGTMDLIKEGKIKIYDDVTEINGKKVSFEYGAEEEFDTIITAIGYDNNVDQLIDIGEERKKDLEQNIKKRKYEGEDNLYFCGFFVAPTGMLREISMESGVIAKMIDLSGRLPA